VCKLLITLRQLENVDIIEKIQIHANSELSVIYGRNSNHSSIASATLPLISLRQLENVDIIEKIQIHANSELTLSPMIGYTGRHK